MNFYQITLLLFTTFLMSLSCYVNGKESGSGFQVVRDETLISAEADGQIVLSYYHAECDVPEGVNPIYRKSGFIHPLYSPSGKVLTRIQPKDHYHHYGIWAPWTKTHIEGREVDFWNLAKGLGTVRFAGIKAMQVGKDQCSFSLRQEHVDLKADGGPRVAIDEIWDIRVSEGKNSGQKYWMIDLVITLENVLDCPIELNQYRYGGGLGFRATEYWTKDNSSVLTSEGKSRKEADGTRARWCDVNGGFEDGTTAGILFLSHPENYEHPEPMRVWPENSVGGRGEMFFEFCPIRINGWQLKPGKLEKLRYQMIVYDGKMSSEMAEGLWQAFAVKKRF